MEKINGHIISALPFGKLTKVSDLVYYEGPILTHFVNDSGENFLFHWVDYDENFNRWLVLQVGSIELFEYLRNEKTLNDIFCSPVNSLLFFVDIDSNGVFQKIYLDTVKTVNEVYIPEKESFFNNEITEYYLELIKKNEPLSYLYSLKENAFYLKLKPAKKIFETTVSTEDVAFFLNNLTESVLNFAQIKMTKTIFVMHNVKSIKEKLREYLTPRIIDLKYSSFCVGLSIDTLQRDALSVLTGAWKKELITEYKGDVVEAELEKDDVLARITQKYTPAERHLIYDPYVKATENKNYYVVITNKFNKDLSRIKILPQKKIEILLPVETKIKIEPKVTERIGKVEVTEGKRTTQKVVGLFDQNVDSIMYSFEVINHMKNTYKFKFPLYCKYDEHDEMVFIENEHLGIFAQGNTTDEAIAMFSEEFDFIFNRYNELPEDKLTEDVISIKHYINSIIVK